MTNRTITRREFVSRTASLAGAVMVTGLAGPVAGKEKLTATDQVKLGKTGLKISRLGLGAGSKGGSIQRALGQDGFNRLIRYAYDRGITYIDTADSYQTHEMVR
ncbi:MAG TPA: aldo/keto reductase, partial [Phycisphaerales bacterium]|nr:aldo/keto reductase [Phycisphaerales bacterium]